MHLTVLKYSNKVSNIKIAIKNSKYRKITLSFSNLFNEIKQKDC